MSKSVAMLRGVVDIMQPVLDKLAIKTKLDLQERVEGEDDQLCVGAYIVCADSRTGSYDIIEELDTEGAEVAVLCFPSAIHVVRYIVGKMLMRGI